MLMESDIWRSVVCDNGEGGGPVFISSSVVAVRDSPPCWPPVPKNRSSICWSQPMPDSGKEYWYCKCKHSSFNNRVYFFCSKSILKAKFNAFHGHFLTLLLCLVKLKALGTTYLPKDITTRPSLAIWTHVLVQPASILHLRQTHKIYIKHEHIIHFFIAIRFLSELTFLMYDECPSRQTSCRSTWIPWQRQNGKNHTHTVCHFPTLPHFWTAIFEAFSI